MVRHTGNSYSPAEEKRCYHVTYLQKNQNWKDSFLSWGIRLKILMFLSDECCMVTGRKRILHQMFCSGTKLCFICMLSSASFVFQGHCIHNPTVCEKTGCCWTHLWHSGWEKYLQSSQFQCKDNTGYQAFPDKLVSSLTPFCLLWMWKTDINVTLNQIL